MADNDDDRMDAEYDDECDYCGLIADQCTCDECGLMPYGTCLLAGTEFCDWVCKSK